MPAGEGELRPHVHFVRPVELCQPIFRVVADSADLFQFVTAHAVVEHNISEHLDAYLMKGLDRRGVFIFCAVFGSDRSLLVELSEIIHIINAVADILLRGAFIGRR